MESTENIIIDSADLSSSLSRILDVIFKNSPDGVVFKDNKFRYLMANDAFCKCYKINDFSNFLGSEEALFLSKENQKIILEINNLISEELKPFSYIMNLSGIKNRVVHVTSSPVIWGHKFIGIISTVKDITQEENVKERFVLKHYQLKSLLENIPMLIFMQDIDLNYIAGTKPSQDFFEKGYDAFTNTYLNLSKNSNEDKKESLQVINNNEILVNEKEILDRRGIPHWYKLYKVPINDFNGEVTGIITLANNIDAEKQLQAQRESFVASVGHDLKNPTIAQIRSLELLLKGNFGVLNCEQKELLEMVLDSCRYMNGMLSSLLVTYRNYGGVIKLSFEDFSLSDLVSECVSEMVYVAKDKGINIYLNSKAEFDLIQADRIQIKRVVMNLLSNGIKYAFKDSLLTLSIYQDKNNLCFEFENNSPYIPPEKQKTLFAQYVSYAAAYNELGIGLGLYASQKIIEGHCGHLFVKSYKDNRNIFGFKLPYRQISCDKEVRF